MIQASLISYGRTALALWLLLVSTATAQFDFGDFGGLGGGAADAGSEVSVESQFTPATDDRPALLFVTAKIADGFHVYAIDQTVLPNGGGGPMATQIKVAADAGVTVTGEWQSIEAPETHIDHEIWEGLELREFSKKVTWFAPISIPAGADPASLTIQGNVEGQACNPATCIPFETSLTATLGEGLELPADTKFTIAVPPTQTVEIPSTDPSAQSTEVAPPPVTAQASTPLPSDANLYDLSQVSLTETQEGSVIYYLITAFLGGLILNVMPCVLPVIGLKIMSFVQQAGQSRAHAFALNVWYSAGILAVFLALATMVVMLKVGWGTQFSSASFSIALIGIVFAMSLSLLGLWDIPIPGFVGSSAAVEITEREGPTAAFLKGILTTLLATPCIGPLMTPALTWAVKQPFWMTYSVFTAVGIGMASPYLLIGAFPSLIRFLPKPGMWMETFKKVMGLVLLATVVWLMTSIDAALAVPTVALMVGIAAGCWWVSQTPVTAPLDHKAYGWVTAAMIVTITAMFSYGWLYRDVMKPRLEKRIAKYAEQEIGEHRLRLADQLARVQTTGQLREVIATLSMESLDSDNKQWQHFSLAKLGQLTLGEGRTVLVDFTADWCVSCKVLEKTVLKTAPVEEALTLANVVTLEADFTKMPESIDRTIKALGGIGVPLIAIFPANDPYHPIVFSNGIYTKRDLIEAIAQATGRKDLMQGRTDNSAVLSRSNDDQSRR